MTVCKNLTHGEDYGLLSLKIASYLYIGIFRLLSFIILFIIFYYSKKYAQRTGNLGRARFFLILPIYMDFLRLLILYCFFVGVVNIVFRNFFLSPFTLSLQLGGFHFFYEGLWFFFTQFGAGRKAFLRSSSFGLLSGAVSFFAFFTAMHFMDDGDDDSANYILLAYNVMYVGMSLLPICIPTELLYRRPAMLPYSVMQVAYYALFIIAVVLVFFGVDAGYCVAATNYILLDGILKPVIIFYTLSVDSQYWQGIGVDENPLMGAWDIDMSMADTISKVDCISVCYADNTFALTTPSQVDSRQGSSVPFIHFGLIELSKDMGFVAGGFSRVYFGQYKNQPIALKMLFVVDLTPQSVKEFCKEANLLIKLKNENVIVCKGVSVMPPAISIVLEFCKYGSLFDLLYKERHTRKHFYQNSLNVLLGPDTIPQHSTRVFSVASASDNLNPLNRRSFMSDGRGSDGIAPAELSSRSCTVSNESSGISETLIRSSQTRSRKSFFGRESLFGGKAVREESKNLLFTHSQSKLSSEWDKLRRWFTDNPGYSASPIIEDEFSMQSEASLFRWSSSQVKSPNVPTRRRADEKMYMRTDIAQAVLDGLPLGHSLSVLGKLEFMSDVVRGISFLHAKGYMHCDIKSLNFLVNENFTVKIADLGEARRIIPDGSDHRRDETPVPAFSWCPPEVLDLSNTSCVYTPASDIYGISMVLAEIINNELPLDKIIRAKKLSFEELLRIISIEKKRPSLPDTLPTALVDILTRAWSNEPDARPTASEILSILDMCTSVLEREV